MGRDLPSGTVTFLFTDVEGSTRLLHALGSDAYADALAEHRRVLRAAFAAHGGVEVDTQGDAFFVAFPTAPGALEAAAEARDELTGGPIRVRMGVHTGTPHLTDEGYVGTDVHRAARIAAAGHGGQVLISAAAAALLNDERLRDLGSHRLKDLSAAERIYQLGDAEFPPLKTLHQTNLPLPATPFLGRDLELAEISALLSRDDVRVLTLTGPGGTGKTRLALQSGASAADAFADGVWWVPLATLRDPGLVLVSAAKALGASGDLAEHIGDKRLLLILDNFEHLLQAAASVAPLLGACPGLSILATSREPLRLDGEWEYAVDPLRDTEAVELFETRARAVRRDFEGNGEVRQICARLDNLPLAIELAAARVKMLSPRALLERLEQRLPLLAGGTRDAPERQRTLRATIEWSHELLTADEQRLLARLAVFRGGCTLDAAESVADADLDTLQSLVSKSLVRVRDDRFSMLETIREFALEQLESSGEADDLRHRHAERFLALAEEAEPHLRRSGRKRWLEGVERDHDNIRAAIDHLARIGDPQRALQLASAMCPFWDIRSHWAEGRRRLEILLSADDLPTLTRARALAGASKMATFSSDAETGRRWAEEAAALCRSLGDTWGTANSLFALAYAVVEDGDLTRAQGLLEESIRTFDDLGDEHSSLHASYNLAGICEDAGDRERARTLHEANLLRARAVGDERAESMALGSVAGFAREAGHARDAVEMLATSTRIERDLGDPTWLSINLVRLGATLNEANHPDAAVRLVAVAEAHIADSGLRLPPWAQQMKDQTLEAAGRSLDATAFSAAREAGRRLNVDEALALALNQTI